MTAFGTNIVEIRKKRGLTQQQLGARVGVDKRVISKYEKGQTVPSVQMAQSIANALEVSLDYLVGSDKALFIDDQEVIQLLRHYEGLKTEAKQTLKTVLKAITLYDQVKQTV